MCVAQYTEGEGFEKAERDFWSKNKQYSTGWAIENVDLSPLSHRVSA